MFFLSMTKKSFKVLVVASNLACLRRVLVSFLHFTERARRLVVSTDFHWNIFCTKLNKFKRVEEDFKVGFKHFHFFRWLPFFLPVSFDSSCNCW